MKRRLHMWAKCFFGLLANDTEADGLGLSDPASSIEVPDRIRREVEILDPMDIIKLDIDDYWRTLAAVLGYGGLRLAEAAALTWDHIDEPYVYVRETEVHKTLKNEAKKRDAKPFPNMWDFLKKHKRKGKFVFWRNDAAKRETWFREYKGKALADALSVAFKEQIERATSAPLALATENDDGDEVFRLLELPYEPALKLPHFWETMMRKGGHENLIEAMGGHSNATGKRFYTRNEELIKSAEIKRIYY
jgi:integrase